MLQVHDPGEFWAFKNADIIKLQVGRMRIFDGLQIVSGQMVVLWQDQLPLLKGVGESAVYIEVNAQDKLNNE